MAESRSNFSSRGDLLIDLGRDAIDEVRAV
jgi:hypothetical protein